MEESQTSSKKRRRNSAEKLLAKQKDYTFSSEDLLTLNHWEQTLKNQRTRSTYIGAILLVCDYYRKPIHEITPEEWVLYVNSVMPDQIVKREISVSTSRIRYYAIIGFLDFYSINHPSYAETSDQFLNPAHAPTPKIFRCMLQRFSLMNVHLHRVRLLSFRLAHLSEMERMEHVCCPFLVRQNV